MSIQEILTKELKGIIAEDFFETPPVDCAFENIENAISNHFAERSIKLPPAPEQPNWEGLHAYRINFHPNNLIVITNATPEQMGIIVKTWDTDTKNIEDHIIGLGLFAITAGVIHNEPFEL